MKFSNQKHFEVYMMNSYRLNDTMICDFKRFHINQKCIERKPIKGMELILHI